MVERESTWTKNQIIVYVFKKWSNFLCILGITRFSMKMTGYWALYDQTQVPLFLAMRDFLNDVQEALRVW